MFSQQNIVFVVIVLAFLCALGIALYGLITNKINRIYLTGLVSTILIGAGTAIFSQNKEAKLENRVLEIQHASFKDDQSALDRISQIQVLLDREGLNSDFTTSDITSLKSKIASLKSDLTASLPKTEHRAILASKNQEIRKLKESKGQLETQLLASKNETQSYKDYLSRLGIQLSSNTPSVASLITGLLNSVDLKAAFLNHLKTRKYYHVLEDKTYVEEDIADLTDWTNDVHKALNELLRNGEGPFKREFIKVKLSIPSHNRIPDDQCAVRKGSVFWLKKLEVTENALIGKTSPIRAVNQHFAPPSEDDVELIQVNQKTAKKILGIDTLPSSTVTAYAMFFPLD
ncbi:hypothetical protein ACFPK9_07945 [Rubritalea spongiae]|uniref:Uncharacterized protein n=1 Tax=Rubritalea spongiae TaxID=430797 RepID=A0ABW5E3V6_9BACT